MKPSSFTRAELLLLKAATQGAQKATILQKMNLAKSAVLPSTARKPGAEEQKALTEREKNWQD